MAATSAATDRLAGTGAAAARVLLALAAVLLAPGGQARAAPPETAPVAGETSSYPPEFFAASMPQTALDMVERVPGVELDPGEGARGLAGTGGNVLIDGRQPVSRSEPLAEMLRRVPATDVAYIERIGAPRPGIEMGGHAVVLNVVRKPRSTAWLAATAAATLQDRRVQPQLTLQAGSTGRAWSLDGTASAYHAPGLERRTREIEFDRSFRLSSDVALATSYRNRGLDLSGRAQRQSEDRSLTLNAGYSLGTSVADVVTQARSAALPSPGWTYSSESRNRFAELGAELELPVGGSDRIRLNAIHTDGSTRFSDRYADPFYNAISDARSDSRETILRATATHRVARRLELEMGAEGALNSVDQAFRLAIDGIDVAVPGDDVAVDERRAEAHLEARWQPRAPLSVAATLRWEGSRLHLDEPGGSHQRHFSYLKPRLLITLAPAPKTSLRLRAEREVGQLAFSDFVASASLQTLVIDAGNVALSPERAWTLEAEAERSLCAKGRAVISLRYSEVENAIDWLPLAGGFQAIGNVGRAKRWQLRANATLPLDAAIAGGLLRLNVTRRWSDVRDPVTGLHRRLSRELPWEGSIRFSQDLKRLRTTWGLDYALATTSRRYRVAEAMRFESPGRFTLYAEHRPSSAWELRAQASLDDRSASKQRLVFDRNRSSASIRAGEVRRTRRGQSLMLSLVRRF